MADDKVSSNDVAILLAILLLATVLRVIGLNQPLWYDEILTITTHLRLPWQGMMQDYSMNHHYGFSLLAKLSESLFGEHPWSVRLPAMLFGVGSIWAMWSLSRYAASTKVAHVTALLLALSYHHIWFSQNARGYTEMAFWATLGTILFMKGVAHPKRSTWIWYGVVLMLTVFTHLTGAFVFVAHGLIWLAMMAIAAARGQMTKQQFTMPFLGYLVGGILTLAVYSPVFASMINVLGGVSETSGVDVMQEYQNPIWTVLEGIRTGIGSAGPVVGLVAVLVIALCMIGATQSHKKAPLFAPIVLVHILVTILLLTTLGMRVWPRFFFVDIGFLMLLIVLGVQLACNWFGRLNLFGLTPARSFVLASLAMVAVSAVLASRNYTLPKQNMAGAVALVAQERKPDERVLVVGPAAEAFNDFFETDWTAILDSQDYEAEMRKPGPLMIVVAFPTRSFRSIPEMDADRDGQLQTLKQFYGTLGDGSIYVLQRS